MTSAGPVPLGRSATWLIRIGLAGALVTLLGGVLLRTLAARPFLPVDESANVAYALEVTHGRLPLAGRHPIAAEFPGQRRASQHASNHPPLYHAIVGPILRLSLRWHHTTAGVLAARLVSLLFSIGTVLLAGLLAWTLASRDRARDPPDGSELRRRAMLTVAVAGLAGALPHIVTTTSIIENDALATCLVLGAVVAFVRIVVLGRTARRLTGLALCSAAASLTRVTSLPAVLILCTALLVAGLIWPSRPGPGAWRRIGSAVWPPAVVLGATAAAAGWFLVLNQERYGDWSGGKAVESLVHGHEPGASSVVSYLSDPRNWLLQLQEVVGGQDSRHGPDPRSTHPMALILAGVFAVGLVALLVRLALRQVRISGRVVLCVLALTVLLCASMGEIAVHAVDAGLPHGRYLLPAAGAFLLAGAAFLLAYPLYLGPLAVAAAVGAECWGTYETFAAQLHRWYPHMTPWQTMQAGLHDMGIPAHSVVHVALLSMLAVGVLVQLVALAGLSRVGRSGLTT